MDLLFIDIKLAVKPKIIKILSATGSLLNSDIKPIKGGPARKPA